MNEVEYNVKVFVNKNGYNSKDKKIIEKKFNQKLLKIIISLEKNKVCQV